MARKDELVRRARENAEQNGLALGDKLGFGVHGIVFSAESQTKTEGSNLRSAVKIHERETEY